MPRRVYLNDVVEFQPTWGCSRIVTITGLGRDGFTGVLTANKTDKALGRYDQIRRILKRGNPDVDHKAKTVAAGDTTVAWICACGHSEVNRGVDVEDAMRESRIQQGRHRDATRQEA